MHDDYESPHHQQQLEEQYSGLEMLLLLDETGRIIFSSPSLLSGVGHQAEEVVGQSLFDYVHPEDQAAIQTALGLALSQAGLPIRRNVRFRWQAGGWLAMDATLTNLLAVAQLGALVMTMHALPDDQPAALSPAEDKFTALFELAPDAIFLADVETGLLVDANPAAVELMGKSRAQLIGTHFTALHPPDQLALAQELFGQPLSPEHLISAWAEIEVLAAGGVRKAVEIRGRIITLNERDYVLGSFRDVTPRKQMEMALRESEARNRAILEAIPDLMFRLNRQGDIIDFRANDPQDLVLSPEQVIGSNIYSNMPPEVTTLILDHIVLTLDTGLPQIIEYNLAVRGGLHDFEARLMASGQDEVVAIVRNITHRKRAEAALSDSEARFRTVWEVVSDAMVLSDPTGIVLAANPAYAELYGYPLDQVIGHSFAIIFPPEDRAWAVEQYQIVFASPEVPTAFESQVQRANGEQRMVESRMNFIVQNGQRVAMLSTIRDITERKKAEDQLRQLSQAVEQSPTSIIITDVEGNIEYVNPAFTANTGYTFAEVKGRNPSILKSELTPPQIYVELWNTVLAGETYRCEFHNRKKNGELSWDEAIISPIKDEQGRIIHLLATQENITERKEFEQERANLEMQLRQTQRLETIGTLAGGIAHDFNNILTPILGFSELGLMRSAADNPVRPQLEHILRASHRAKDLVQQILTFSRQTEHERVPTELQPLIKEVLKLLRPSLPTTIEIRQDIDPVCPPILADPSQIHQVLMNLCTNAYHAMQKSGGVLTLELSSVSRSQITSTAYPDLLPNSDYTRLIVTDTGHGMDPITVDRIFEPFFTTKPMGKGTGLGLSVVHGIVKNHGGTIMVHSSLGRGTAFELLFPVASAQTAPKKRPAPPPAGHKERILLVDDEAAIVELLVDWLTNAGYRVTSRTSSLEALALFQEDPSQFEVVITDLTMPHTTGLALSRALKTLRPELPIIMITGYGEDLNEANLIHSGIDHLVMKPIVFNELGQALRHVLDEVP